MRAPAQIVQGQPEDVANLPSVEQIAVVPLKTFAIIGPFGLKNPLVKIDFARQSPGASDEKKV